MKTITLTGPSHFPYKDHSNILREDCQSVTRTSESGDCRSPGVFPLSWRFLSKQNPNRKRSGTSGLSLNNFSDGWGQASSGLKIFEKVKLLAKPHSKKRWITILFLFNQLSWHCVATHKHSAKCFLNAPTSPPTSHYPPPQMTPKSLTRWAPHMSLCQYELKVTDFQRVVSQMQYFASWCTKLIHPG